MGNNGISRAQRNNSGGKGSYYTWFICWGNNKFIGQYRFKKNPRHISRWLQGRLNRIPAGGLGDVISVTIKKGKPELKKKVMTGIVVRQRRLFRRANGSR